MKKTVLILILTTLCLPALLHGQGTDNALENDFRGRVSVEIDKKVSKGFHVFAEGQVRAIDNFSTVGRYQATAGLSYKLRPWLKGALSYVFMEKLNSDNELSLRHRVSLDLTASHRQGPWRFSLKERLQLNHRPGTMNEYQGVRNALYLKSRVKAAYKLTGDVSPYAFVEIKNTLNAPTITADYDETAGGYLTSGGSETGEAGWFMDGYRDVYICRYRGAVGLEYALSRQHALDFFLMADYCRDKNIDANKSGTRLKSFTYDRALHITAGVGYTYSF
ncbi:MAG: DUF2490 domain-containing protein [Bacteroidales bacterium]|nr:DUF2490 domain-containing protein [Bacteroidales bacterium]